MEQQKLVVTTKDKRYHVHKDVLDKKLKGSEAAQILGLSSAYLPRLKKRLLYDGFDGLLRKFPASAPHKKISEKDARQVLWEGFGLTVEGGLEQLATVCSIEAKVKGQDTRRMKIPQPREQSLGL